MGHYDPHFLHTTNALIIYKEKSIVITDDEFKYFKYCEKESLPIPSHTYMSTIY